jgi:bifunctional non-homologous end joining protein LigD
VPPLACWFGAPQGSTALRSFARKRKLAKLVRGPHPGIVLNEFFEGDGDILFEHACKLGCEGIVSKRLGSTYGSGRSKYWVKVKNPKAPAVKRETEEDWR